MDVSVIIVNYNTTKHIAGCLSSILEISSGIVLEIIVVDNNSPEREIEQLPQEFNTVKFFFRKVNDGFGAGCNFGVSKSSGKYLAFINPDIVFKSNALKTFFDYMEGHERTGLCSGVLVNESNKPIYSFNRFPGFYWEFSDALMRNGDSKIAKLLDDRDLSQNAEPFEVDWAIGACMFMRRNVFEELNGFDEDLFLYSEDVDLQLRMHKLGKSVMCLPSVRLEHFSKSSVSSAGGDDVYNLNIHLSKLKYMRKHFGLLKEFIIRIFYINGMLIRLISLPIRRKFKGTKPAKAIQLMKILILYLSPAIKSHI